MLNIYTRRHLHNSEILNCILKLNNSHMFKELLHLKGFEGSFIAVKGSILFKIQTLILSAFSSDSLSFENLTEKQVYELLSVTDDDTLERFMNFEFDTHKTYYLEFFREPCQNLVIY